MGIIKKLFFKIDSIVMGAAAGLIIKREFEEAWELSYSLAQRTLKKGRYINFGEGIYLCTKVLEHKPSVERLTDIVDLFLSAKCERSMLEREEKRLVALLEREGLAGLKAKMLETLQTKY